MGCRGTCKVCDWRCRSIGASNVVRGHVCGLRRLRTFFEFLRLLPSAPLVAIRLSLSLFSRRVCPVLSFFSLRVYVRSRISPLRAFDLSISRLSFLLSLLCLLFAWSLPWPSPFLGASTFPPSLYHCLIRPAHAVALFSCKHFSPLLCSLALLFTASALELRASMQACVQAGLLERADMTWYNCNLRRHQA